MLNSIYIYGAGGRGREISDLARSLNCQQIIFLDDFCSKGEILGLKVLKLLPGIDTSIPLIVGVGEPKHRQALMDRGRSFGLSTTSLISPLASISDTANIGSGVSISPFVSIQSSALIGENVDINTGAIIGHDVCISDCAVISSQVNLGGGVSVGEGTYIGMGTLIKEGINIGRQTIIGMGSVVYNDIPDGVIALGSPARVMKRNVSGLVFGA